MYNRACDIDGCNVWKCAEPLLSTKQNSIRLHLDDSGADDEDDIDDDASGENRPFKMISIIAPIFQN